MVFASAARSLHVILRSALHGPGPRTVMWLDLLNHHGVEVLHLEAAIIDLGGALVALSVGLRARGGLRSACVLDLILVNLLGKHLLAVADRLIGHLIGLIVLVEVLIRTGEGVMPLLLAGETNGLFVDQHAVGVPAQDLVQLLLRDLRLLAVGRLVTFHAAAMAHKRFLVPIEHLNSRRPAQLLRVVNRLIDPVLFGRKVS
jgi:hypothetical protein